LILREAWGALGAPSLADAEPVGLLVNGLAMALNLVWARVLIEFGQRNRSPALTASGRHLMADVWTSVGVLAGVGVALATGWAILDPILAILVALHVLREGWNVVFHSAGDLMDSAASAEDRDAIEDAVRASSQGALQIHDLRTRRAGQVLFVEFHLVVDRDMSVGAAHDICDTIEDAIAERLPGAQTTIHLEPDSQLEADGIQPDPDGGA
jgi:cation diffusion facilitator family transporter